MDLTPRTLIAAVLAVALGFALLAYVGLADYYLSYLYIVFFWVALASSWGLLSGLTGYWSFGHAAFYGIGVYTTATLSGRWGAPFLLTIPVAALVAALVALGVGLVVFRVKGLRGEFFALLTLSITFVLAAIVSNTPIDGGAGVILNGVAVPELASSAPASIYLLGLFLATAAILTGLVVAHSKFGLGLAAIHDDEDAAEVKGVPTLRYKLYAFMLSSAIAGAVGAVQAVYIGYITVGETFAITVPLYVVLMSILGGARHWLGPALGAVVITVALNSVASAGQAELGKAGVALGLVLAILFLPEGVTPFVARMLRRLGLIKTNAPPAAAGEPSRQAPAAQHGAGDVLVTCADVVKSFGGIQALRGVTLDVMRGEILALVGPNGSGKSTLINTISGHFPLTSGSIRLGEREIGALAPHAIAGLGVARTYQIPRLFDHLSVRENVALCSVFASDTTLEAARRDAAHWLAFTGLSEHADATPPSLTLHERKFLEFARALAARPTLLLLDEVLCGLNPTEAEKAVALIRRIRDNGATIVFVEHLMRVVVALSDRIAVLDQGRVLALGPPRETMSDPRVVSAYLGTAYAA